MKTEYPSLSGNELEVGDVLAPRFNSDGLITAVVQESSSGDILMLAHMNGEALQKTLQTGQAHFWSRSRSELWHKGATSGNYLLVDEVHIDCDQDAVVVKASQVGSGACHTGRRSCFYRSIEVSDGEFRLRMIDTK
jgi:phosphoribosyl-AMP cyclohydrolase